MALRTRNELAPFFAAAAAEAKVAWDSAEQARIEAGGDLTRNSPAEPYLPLADFLEESGDPRHIVVKAYWANRPTPGGCSSDDWLFAVSVVTLPDGSTIRLDAYRGGVIVHWDGFQSWAAQADKLDAPLPFSGVLTATEALALAESLPEGETTTANPSDEHAPPMSKKESSAAFVRRLYSL